MSKFILAQILGLLILGCGVRGDPVPPQRPVEIGRGKPSYKRATEKIKVEDRFKEDLPTEDTDTPEEEQ